MPLVIQTIANRGADAIADALIDNLHYDPPSPSAWYDYSHARDMMLKARDTKHAPWYILGSDEKKHVRLDCISHLLSLIPYKKVPREKVKLPKRSKKAAYDDQTSWEGRKYLPEKY